MNRVSRCERLTSSARENGRDFPSTDGALSRRGFIHAGSLLALNTAVGSSQAKPPEVVAAPIIDTHMHVWGNDDKRYPFPHPYVPGFSIRNVPHEATVEILIEDMRE